MILYDFAFPHPRDEDPYGDECPGLIRLPVGVEGTVLDVPSRCPECRHTFTRDETDRIAHKAQLELDAALLERERYNSEMRGLPYGSEEYL